MQMCVEAQTRAFTVCPGMECRYNPCGALKEHSNLGTETAEFCYQEVRHTEDSCLNIYYTFLALRDICKYLSGQENLVSRR